MTIEVYADGPNDDVIDTLYVFMGTDEKGNNGIIAHETSMGWSPMITGHLRVAEKMKPLAMEVATQTGQTINLWAFKREESVWTSLT